MSLKIYRIYYTFYYFSEKLILQKNFMESYGLVFILFLLIVITFLIVLLIIPVKMANRRGRSGILWFLFSLIISPFLSMLFLFLLGETDEKREERIIQEEILRNQYRNSNGN